MFRTGSNTLLIEQKKDNVSARDAKTLHYKTQVDDVSNLAVCHKNLNVLGEIISTRSTFGSVHFLPLVDMQFFQSATAVVTHTAFITSHIVKPLSRVTSVFFTQISDRVASQQWISKTQRDASLHTRMGHLEHN